MSSTVSDSSSQEETFQQKRAVRIYMPDRLKSLLVDDWENITKNLQLVQLPADKPAAIILDEYLAFATSTGSRNSTETDILEEVIQGLKEYFNKALGRLLLYRFEREQFYDISQQVEQPTHDFASKSMSEIYGGEHLLRLFGRSLSDMLWCPHFHLLTTISLDARADRPD
jgi:mortality factor 4-like protein 1